MAICDSPKDGSVSYHSFPKAPDIRRAWVAACHRKDHFNPNTTRVCSRHFKSEDFERDLRNELLNLNPRRLLKKKSSIPTLLLLPDNPCKRKASDRSREERGEKRRRTEIINKLTSSTSHVGEGSEEHNEETPTIAGSQVQDEDEEHVEESAVEENAMEESAVKVF